MITTAQPTAPINECAPQMGTRGSLAKAKTVDQLVAPSPAAVYRSLRTTTRGQTRSTPSGKLAPCLLSGEVGGRRFDAIGSPLRD
jgi:hypothetical protein